MTCANELMLPSSLMTFEMPRFNEHIQKFAVRSLRANLEVSLARREQCFLMPDAFG
jgi:hypothetical protein